ncbi:MAG: metal-dependent transcriptional regulator [Anaerolineales bacterium]
MGTKISETIEDYLSIMLVLERDNEPIIGARLAEIIGVTPPTVTNTLKRMARDGYIYLDEKSGTHLTEQGLEAAKSVMRRHMLTEWLLAPMLGWSKTHSQAHAMEHAVSDELEAALKNEMENPPVCPHGNPLPGFEEYVADWKPLLSFSVGSKVTIRRIHELAEQNQELLAFLEEKGVMPGKTALITENIPFNQTVTLEINQAPVILGYSVARYIYATLITESERTPIA